MGRVCYGPRCPVTFLVRFGISVRSGKYSYPLCYVSRKNSVITVNELPHEICNNFCSVLTQPSLFLVNDCLSGELAVLDLSPVQNLSFCSTVIEPIVSAA